MDYVEAIDALLGFVGQRVHVLVDRDDVPVASMKGELRQGQPDDLTKLMVPGLPEAGQVSYFALDDQHGHGIYVVRSAFEEASRDEDALTIRLAGVRVTVMPN